MSPQASDRLARDPWRAKPVGFVSYGGVSGGLRAVEQLRLVFAELHAVTVRDTVSLRDVLDAHAGQRGPLAAAQTGGAPLTVALWEPDVSRSHRLAQAAQVGAQLIVLAHVSSRDRDARRQMRQRMWPGGVWHPWPCRTPVATVQADR